MKHIKVPTNSEMVAYIESFQSRTGMTDCRFGINVFRDPSFMRELRGGRDIKLGSAQRIVDFIKAN